MIFPPFKQTQEYNMDICTILTFNNHEDFLAYKKHCKNKG